MAQTPIKPSLITTQALRSPPDLPAWPASTTTVPRGQARRVVGAHAARMSAQAHMQSRNWAGAVVPATMGQRFTRIEGTWTVPKIDESGAAKGLFSIWVGLGGSHPGSSSMPQIGSEHGWDGENWVSRLWCQWWLGGSRVGGFVSRWISGVVLRPGDSVTCSLEVVGAAGNQAKGRRVAFQWLHNATLYREEVDGDVPVMADSANWIVERPTQVYWPARKPGMLFQPGITLGQHHPLPRFLDDSGQPIQTGREVAVLRGCAATLDGASGVAATTRHPGSGRLVTLRSILPWAGRGFVELEPAVTESRRSDVLRVVRHLP